MGPGNVSSRSTSGSDSSSLVYIPFVQDVASIVNAVLAVRLDVSDTIWRILYASNYESFGFNTSTDTAWNARNVFQFFALFQNDIFGHTKFLIKDQRLFNSTEDSSVVTLKKKNGVAVNSRINRTTEWHIVTECGSWQVCGITPAQQARSSSTNDDCVIVEICNTYYYDDLSDPGGGGSGWTGISWTNGNGSGGGSGTWANGDPCGTQSGPCTAAWTPIISYAVVDGVTYTSENYPGMGYNLPWLWWENNTFLSPFGGTDFGIWAIHYLSQNPNIPFSVFQNQFMTPNEGQDGGYDANYWDDPNLTFPQQTLPSWNDFSSAFPQHDDPLYNEPEELYTNIGGNVLAQYNTNPDLYQNTCALRVSKALNYSGVTISAGTDRYQGADGKYYFLSCAALLKWMKKTFGTPSGSNHLTGSQGGTYGENFPSLLATKKGIYFMTPNFPGGCGTQTIPPTGFCASGHADMINNGDCDGGCYFDARGGVSEIFIWELQ